MEFSHDADDEREDKGCGEELTMTVDRSDGDQRESEKSDGTG